MRRALSALFLLLFFVILIGGILWVNVNRPRVMVLHSYDNDYIWTRDVNEGINRVFDHQSNLYVQHHDMGTKKHSGKDYLRRAAVAARQAISRFEPDVLIAVDDYAQKLVAMEYVGHPSMSVVFAGVNGSIEPYGYDGAPNVTGILERKPVKALKQVLMILASTSPTEIKGKPRVLFLSDASHSAERDAEYLDGHDWSPLEYLGHKSQSDYAGWKQQVLELEGKVDYLLVGGYRKVAADGDNAGFVPPEEIMEWTEQNSPAPVIGINIFNSRDGAMLSVGVSPYEQGEVAAEMAMAIIREGKRAGDIPVATSSQFVIAMRESVLQRRHIVVPEIFEAFAKATDNYFD